MIADEIGQLAMESGWESWIAYGREPHGDSKSNLIRVGSDWDMRWHGVQSRLFDNHGLASKRATKRLIEQLREISPDIIHLHNIHGYYLNYPILFKYLKEWGGPVVWTLHDIWAITGHCAYFGVKECAKWRSECNHCPRLRTYPASWLCDASARNFHRKRELFTSLENMTLVSVSDWLSELLSHSFLANCHRITIHNGVDLTKFHPEKTSEISRPYILGIANVWDERKGLRDFITLRELLPTSIDITLVGLTQAQIDILPKGVVGIRRTTSRDDLAKLYSNAIALVNPTWEDNFPTVNIEALASGTPVITYKTGGSPEAIDADTGIVVERGDIQGLANAVTEITHKSAAEWKKQCRQRAVAFFNKNEKYKEYLALYEDLDGKNGGGYLLCISGHWVPEKGINDIFRLRQILPQRMLIVMVGVSPKILKKLPRGIVGIPRTSNREELRILYAGADALLNPTWGDTFGMINVEALACGTPVVTYRTGGSPEAIDERTGIVVEQGDINGLVDAIYQAEKLKSEDCRQRVEQLFDKNLSFNKYINLYNEILGRGG